MGPLAGCAVVGGARSLLAGRGQRITAAAAGGGGAAAAAGGGGAVGRLGTLVRMHAAATAFEQGTTSAKACFGGGVVDKRGCNRWRRWYRQQRMHNNDVRCAWRCVSCRMQELESQPAPSVQIAAADKQQQQLYSISSEGLDAAQQQEQLQEQQEQPHANGVAGPAEDTAAGKAASLLQELQGSYAALQAAVAAAADASAEVRQAAAGALHCASNSTCLVLCCDVM